MLIKRLALPDVLFCVFAISYYKDNIVVILRDRGGAKVECNTNDIIWVMGYNSSIPYKVTFGNYVKIFCLVNKHIGDNYLFIVKWTRKSMDD